MFCTALLILENTGNEPNRILVKLIMVYTQDRTQVVILKNTFFSNTNDMTKHLKGDSG